MFFNIRMMREVKLFIGVETAACARIYQYMLSFCQKFWKIVFRGQLRKLIGAVEGMLHFGGLVDVSVVAEDCQTAVTKIAYVQCVVL